MSLPATAFYNDSTTCTTNPFQWHAYGHFGCALHGVFVLSRSSEATEVVNEAIVNLSCIPNNVLPRQLL